ncbi:MAG: YdeI/OmpD-associated family protein [Planctomycetota bacterium]|nr:YdeI/OmpD-associated family protein [Planctomycetota bacterium]
MTPPVQTDPRVDAYIQKAAPFAQPILEKIRAGFHAGCPDLQETIKWGVPSFERNGMLGGMAAFKKHVSFGFWRAPEMEDTDGLLGETRKSSPMRIQAKTVADLPTKKVLVSYVKQAKKLDNKEGSPARKAVPKKPTLKAPKYMLDAIAKKKAAKEFWGTMAPGYKREYVEWITEAKREATRDKRLVQTVEWLAEGKTRHWKYKNC